MQNIWSAVWSAVDVLRRNTHWCPPPKPKIISTSSYNKTINKLHGADLENLIIAQLVKKFCFPPPPPTFIDRKSLAWDPILSEFNAANTLLP
jgi:hypothetical protein